MTHEDGFEDETAAEARRWLCRHRWELRDSRTGEETCVLCGAVRKR